MQPNLKIIYIAGSGRSGTTIIDRVLGTLDGVTSLNQVYPFGEPERQYCSCGNNIEHCPFWTEVMRNSAMLPAGTGRLIQLREKIDHTRYLPLLFTSVGRRFLNDSLQEYLGRLRDLYSAIAVASGGNILVDSSKVASRALILSMIPGFEVYVVHMIRDVRGVAYSWQKKKKRKGGYLTGPPFLQVLQSWIINNIAAELLSTRLSYIRICYEDFARQPRQTVESIISSVEPISEKNIEFNGDRSIKLNTIHSISGNPDRFQAGLTEINADIEWQERLGKKKKLTAKLFSYPLIKRYGYV